MTTHECPKCGLVHGAGTVIPNPALVEVARVWYSVFCTLVDAHNAGEYTDAELLAKILQLRIELAERLPEVEAEVRRQRC